MQLIQIVGERNVRIVPDVAVTGTNGSTELWMAVSPWAIQRSDAAKAKLNKDNRARGPEVCRAQTLF
jgi:hypothetical protein